jgi:phage-related protein
MSDEQWSVVYYEADNGEAVVENEMRAFGEKVFARMLRTIDLLEEFGIELDGDYVEHIEGKIWQLRVGKYRVLYFAFRNKQFVLLRVFVKKTKKTPRQEIRIAKNRLNEYTGRFK